MNKLWLALGFAGLTLVGHASLAADKGKVNVYNWAEYVPDDVLEQFTKESGIVLVYDAYDSSETAEAKQLAGHTGYDLVLNAASALPRLREAKVLQPLDMSRIAAVGDLDQGMLKIFRTYDPDLNTGLPFSWGSVGITYNMAMVTQRLGPNAPLDSLAILFDPAYAAKLADCGISVLDSPSDVIPMVLGYLGKDPNSAAPEDLKAVADLFQPIYKYIKAFDSENYVNALPNEELCYVINWSGELLNIKETAKEAGLDLDLRYVVPKTGAPAWYDTWTLTADAANIDNAYAFLNFLYRPDIQARIGNYTGYAMMSAKAKALMRPEIANDPAVYPDEAVRARLSLPDPSVNRMRALQRIFARIKAGQ